MLLKWIVVAMAMASVTAQGCIPGAEPDGNGGCQCQGGLSGNPELCCYNPSMRGCYVVGDPVLTSFTGKKIGLDFPCGTMVSSSRVDDGQPIINVFAAGREVVSGTIYTSQVKVELRQLVVISLTFSFDASPFFIRHERSDGPADDFNMADGEEKYLNQDGVQGDIIIRYDAGLALFNVEAGGLQINIRPSKGDVPEQENAPGVCIMEPQGSVSPNPGATFACSLNTDVTNTPAYLESAIRPMKNYMFNIGTLKATTDPQYASMCQAYQDTIVGECDPADRNNALKKCAFLLFQPVIRRCFYEGSIGNVRVMEAFLNCLNTYCQGTKALCDELRTDSAFRQCAPSLGDCQSWPPYRRINSFVAGEGEGGFNFGPGVTSEKEDTTPFQFDILGSGGDDQDNGGAGGVGGSFEVPF